MKLPRWLEWLPLGNVPSVDPRDLPCSADHLSEHFLIIDVRTHAEWKLSHISGAVNLPFPDLKTVIQHAGDRKKPILCICLSAHRSTPVVRRLRALGIESYELKGGMLRWWRNKLPTE